MYNYFWKANSRANGSWQRVPHVVSIFPAEDAQGADIVKNVILTPLKGRIQMHDLVAEVWHVKCISF